jgi:hypothetical protein
MENYMTLAQAVENGIFQQDELEFFVNTREFLGQQGLEG